MAVTIKGATTIRGNTTVGFSPASLFAAGEQGVWFDPSDFSTMFQDAAGTTPVTGVEQPVGLLLDKRGGPFGPDLVTNGNFSNGTTGWTASSGSITVSSGELLVTNTGVAYGTGYQSLTTVAGRTYKATADVRAGTATTVYFAAKNSSLASPDLAVANTTSKTTVTRSIIFTATGSTTLILVVNSNENNGTGYADNISVREISPNYATQSTAGSRPTLSARVNLLTKTEQFDDAYWTANKNTITPNDALAPDGTTTAERFTASASGTGNTQVYRQAITGLPTSILGSACFKKGGTSNGWVALAVGDGTNYYTVSFDVTNGAVGTASTIGSPTNTSSSITSLGGGWYRCSVSMTGNSSNKEMYIIAACTSTSNLAPVVGNYDWVWGADLRPTNQGVGLPAYQRVNTSTDYDTTGFPFYLAFNGSTNNRSLATGNINFSGTNKIGLFTGVRKASDGTASVIAESSSVYYANNGTFVLYASIAANEDYGFGLRGTGTIPGSSYAYEGVYPYDAPVTNVVYCGLDATQTTAATCLSPRVNGAVPSISGADQVGQTAGNFGNYPLYIGARAGSSLYFNGNLYSLIVRGAASTSAQISATEAYVNQKTRAY